MYEVLLKPRHPTGSYQRDGIRFNPHKPVLLEKVSERIEKDPWLIVTEAQKPPSGVKEPDPAKKKGSEKISND